MIELHQRVTSLKCCHNYNTELYAKEQSYMSYNERVVYLRSTREFMMRSQFSAMTLNNKKYIYERHTVKISYMTHLVWLRLHRMWSKNTLVYI